MHSNNNKCLPRISTVSVLVPTMSQSIAPSLQEALQYWGGWVSGPAVGTAHTLIWPCSYVFLKLSEQCVFFCGNSHLFFYVLHRDRVCVVDHVNLMCSWYSWWKSFWSSSLITLPLGFNCGFISTSACSLSTGVCSWGCPGGLGSAPVRARCGRGTAAWVMGTSVVSGMQQSQWPQAQKISSKKVLSAQTVSLAFHSR